MPSVPFITAMSVVDPDNVMTASSRARRLGVPLARYYKYSTSKRVPEARIPTPLPGTATTRLYYHGANTMYLVNGAPAHAKQFLLADGTLSPPSRILPDPSTLFRFSYSPGVVPPAHTTPVPSQFFFTKLDRSSQR